MSLEERGLFRERIRVLDKRIHPGLTKLTWASKNVSDYFVSECRLHASKIQANVDDYKGANMNIRELCVKISEMLLVRIDSKVVYEDLKFDEDQVWIFMGLGLRGGLDEGGGGMRAVGEGASLMKTIYKFDKIGNELYVWEGMHGGWGWGAGFGGGGYL